MSRIRFLVVLGGCLLAASAAWADDVGYVECSSHPDGTQVFGKPRKSPEVVASVACGERFTILVYGFVFSRVQTGDGKIGYVYSNLIAVDRAAAPLQKPASPQMVTASEKVAVRTAPVEQPAPSPVAKPQPAPAQSTVTAAPLSAVPEPVSPAPAAAKQNLTEITVSATPPAPAAAPASGSLLPTPPVPETTVTPAPAQPAAAPDSTPASSAPATPAAISSVPEPAPRASQPEPSAAAQPQPDPAQPSAAPAIRPVESHATWERPLPGGRTTTPRVEVFGGYSSARVISTVSIVPGASRRLSKPSQAAPARTPQLPESAVTPLQRTACRTKWVAAWISTLPGTGKSACSTSTTTGLRSVPMFTRTIIGLPPVSSSASLAVLNNVLIGLPEPLPSISK